MQDDRLKRSLGYALIRAFRRANRAAGRAVLPYGISAEQGHILFVLWREGAMKVGQLQRILALSSGTLTGALDRMVEAGLVRRVRHPEDGRAFRVEAAAMDAKRRRAIEAAVEGTEVEVFSALTEAERAALLPLLTKVGEAR